MLHRGSKRYWVAILVLGATLLGAQSQPQAQPQSQSQPPSPQQQAIEAFADKLIAASNEESRNTLLAANPDLVTADLIRFLVFTRGNDLYRANTKTSLAQARAIYDFALTIAERLNNKKWIATCLDNIGIVLEQQVDYEASVNYLYRAMAIREEQKDPLLANSYNNIGLVLKAQGNFREAVEYYKRAAKLDETRGSSKQDIVATAVNLGNAYHHLGNQRLALEQYKRSMEVSQELGYQRGIAYSSNALGNLYESEGDYDLALAFYKRSLEIKEKVGNPREIGATLINLGELYHETGKDTLARESLERALKLKEASGDKNGVAIVLNIYGSILREEGDYGGALEREQACLKASEAIGNQSLQGDALFEMASDYYAQKNYAHALESGRRASEIAQQIGDRSVSQALNITARALSALGKRDEASATFAQAISAVEELRGQVAGSEEDQANFLAREIEPYQRMVQLLLSQNKREEALAFAEQAKARVLLDVMRKGRIRADKAMTQQEKNQEQHLTNRLTSLNAQLSAERSRSNADPVRVNQIGAELDKARLDYRSFQTSIYVAHPELQAERGDARPASLAEINSLLPDTKTALLEFVVGQDSTYLFFLAKDASTDAPRLAAYTLPVDAKELAKVVGRFRRQLAARDPSYGESARALYQLLLHPVRSALAGKTTMIIVPDGPLWELPFQALQPSAGHHLLEDAAVSYAPSFRVLLEMLRRDKRNQNEAPQLLALGNPALNKRAAAETTIAEAGDPPNESVLRDRPQDLPSARREVAAVARFYGAHNSRVYTGATATEEAFKAQAGKYDVLHLATHGVFDNRSPMYSYLMLSEASDDADEDGLLEAWEVMNLDLKADLVVLSACETARGKTSGGEGLIGMSWAFFVAGTPSLVASQWKVDSASTTDLMLQFHRGLRYHSQVSSMPKAKALQQAALSVMKKPQYRHPFYWAGFVLIGNGS